MLIICIALTFGTAYFTSAETAYSSVNQLKLRSLSENGNRSARRAVRILDDFDRALITLLLGTNLLQILLSSLFTLFVIREYGSGYVFTATLILTAVQFIFAEMAPKRAAGNRPMATTLKYSASLEKLIRFFKPVTWVISKITDWVTRILGESPPVVDESELEDMVKEVSRKQSRAQGRLLRSAMKFDDSPAANVMTPIASAVMLSLGSDEASILSEIKHCRHSRLPVIDSNGCIVGIVNIRKYLKTYLSTGSASLEETMEEPFFAAPDVKIDDLLRDLSNSKKNLAVIGTMEHPLGIITVEDIVEELVGEIYDEDDYWTTKKAGGKND
ncbi:MAG: hemolysin family protein [Oscillospiraceae bacterium]